MLQYNYDVKWINMIIYYLFRDQQSSAGGGLGIATGHHKCQEQSLEILKPLLQLVQSPGTRALARHPDVQRRVQRGRGLCRRGRSSPVK
jgi:hypothetical protein